MESSLSTLSTTAKDVSQRLESFPALLRSMVANPPDGSVRMTITPDMAQTMLKHNTGNRARNAARIRQYAADMASGAWLYSGQPIIFADNGQLNDGQHRLHACIAAGVPFETDVKFGVPRKAFVVTDTGKKRTPGDVLRIDGEQHASTLGAALRMLASYNAGQYHLGAVFTAQTLEEVLADHPGMRDSVKVGCSVYRGFRLIPASTLAFCHYVLSGIHAQQCADFFDVLASGAARKTDPVVVLRNQFINFNAKKRRGDKAETCALIFKAWNARRKNITAKLFRWSPDQNEAFPKPE